MVEDEDQALILLSSLSDDEYETFILTLINIKSSLSYDKISATLVNHELRRRDKEYSSSTSTGALTARGWRSNRKGNGDRDGSKSKSDNHDLRKDQYVFRKEMNTGKRIV